MTNHGLSKYVLSNKYAFLTSYFTFPQEEFHLSLPRFKKKHLLVVPCPKTNVHVQFNINKIIKIIYNQYLFFSFTPSFFCQGVISVGQFTFHTGHRNFRRLIEQLAGLFRISTLLQDSGIP